MACLTSTMFSCFTAKPSQYTPLAPERKSALAHRSLGEYPGNRRENRSGEPVPQCLVKTAGNALRELRSELLSATVPEGVKPGQTIHVKAPNGCIVAAVVPLNMTAGQSFLVKIPSEEVQQEDVKKVDLESVIDLKLDDVSCPPEETTKPLFSAGVTENTVSEHSMGSATVASQSGINGSSSLKTVLVQVPPAANPGSLIRVKTPDDQIVEAVVPQCGNITQFYVTYKPRSQNVRDHPMAHCTPMDAGPSLV